jgi:hypothetical protein
VDAEIDGPAYMCVLLLCILHDLYACMLRVLSPIRMHTSDAVCVQGHATSTCKAGGLRAMYCWMSRLKALWRAIWLCCYDG